MVQRHPRAGWGCECQQSPETRSRRQTRTQACGETVASVGTHAPNPDPFHWQTRTWASRAAAASAGTHAAGWGRVLAVPWDRIPPADPDLQHRPTLMPPTRKSGGWGGGRGAGTRCSLAYHMFLVMEDLVEKLKLLCYEEELLRKNNLKPPSSFTETCILTLILSILFHVASQQNFQLIPLIGVNCDKLT
ncbi:Intraflagellar transport protein 57 like protein [Myotis davidii]|uniref:Intraflagellar transport protein 57 like protein n=1 Tax=Myotis davidii TaxID=225400 RepID=L5LXY1_MYODS|nr:Intraflagellar transport protein 57 like protein [Myotis davidii]